jgi:hypothetical protein
MASPNLSELITTTLRHRSGKLADNVTENNALLKRLSEKGKVKPVSGGRTIVRELEYAENATFQWYSGYETLNISPSDVITAAEFDWKQASVAVSINGLEQLQNAGKEQIINLIEARVGNAERTMRNGIAAAVYANGTGNAGKEIGGLQLLVADLPTSGTVGGINRANYSFYRNQYFDATTDGGNAATSSNIQGYMNTMWARCTRGTDAPDLIIADNNYFNLFLGSLQTIQRITDPKMAQAGFTSVKYMNADVVLDGGIGGNCPTNHMYFLNTEYIHFNPHKDRNMVPLDPDRFSTNQDAVVKLLGFAGNMTLSNAQLQGVLKD